MHSPLLDDLIDALRCLPGVGRKSAQRMAYHLLERNRSGGLHLADRLTQALENIQHCSRCRNFSETDICGICANSKRDQQTVCVVESPADLLAIESSQVFSGRYFVLMGHLSPLDGVGPNELGLDLLEQQLANGEINELILATGATIEGEATAQFIQDMANTHQVGLSRIAQGVPLGGELEYIDSRTLAQSINERRKL